MGDYIICANEIGSDDTGSNFSSAFSFTNYLTDTLTLPPNAEVAVQSVKINKNGTITLSGGKSWGFYFGEPIADEASASLTTSAVKRMTPQIPIGTYFPRNLTIPLNQVFNNHFGHPELYNESTVNLKTDSEGVFEGWKILFKQAVPHDTTNQFHSGTLNVRNAWRSGHPGAGLVYESTTHNLRALGGVVGGVSQNAYNIADIIDAPVALNNGRVEFNCSECRSGGTGGGVSSFSVGFSRSLANRHYPRYYSEDDSESHEVKHLFDDFSVRAIQVAAGSARYIRVFHSIKNDDNTITMKEVKYYENSNNPWHYTYTEFLAGTRPHPGINWSNTKSSGSSVRDIRFNFNNEQVNVQIYAEDTDGAGTAAYVDLVKFDLADIEKNQKFKPICDSCRMLYPRVWINRTGAKIHLHNGRLRSTTPQSFTAAQYGTPAVDFFARAEADNDLNQVLDLDTRFYNDYDDDEDYTPLGIVDDLADTYIFKLVIGPDDVYKPSEYANAFSLLGWPEATGAIDGTAEEGGTGTEFLSNNTPPLQSNTSIFVALRNVRVKTYNANMKTRSQILYQLPRFDNSGSQQGTGLYFEPHERLYISCNNPDPLTINAFEINMLNENETYAEDLTGRTVVCLHFRQGQQEWYKKVNV